MAETDSWKQRNPSVLFVNPSMGSERYERKDRLRGYLSLGTLASALRDKTFLQRFAVVSGRKEAVLENPANYPSFDVKVINLSLKPKRLSIKAYLNQFIRENRIDPVMICATATSAQLDEANEVAGAAKVISPEALRVIGGPHVSVLPVEYLMESDYQVACIGEGVETLTEIALRLNTWGDDDLSMVSGIAHKLENGEIILNPSRKHALSLDDYPFPSDSMDLFLDDPEDAIKNKKEVVFLFAGSGCPHHCVFCAQQAVHRGLIRERSADNLFEEIKKLHTMGFRRFAIVQETLLNRKSRIKRLCHLIETSGLTFEWTAEARANQLDLELLKRMRNAGLAFIQIGVETGDQELLDNLDKKNTLEQIVRLRDWCAALKISTTFYMLVGLPAQDWQSILKSAIFLRDHPPYNPATMHVAVASAIPYPGTKIAEGDSVRLLTKDGKSMNWPERNPPVTVTDDGAFEGKRYTETDDMTSDEILESLTFLDDFAVFLLHAAYDTSFTHRDKEQALDFGNRIFYVIMRRTIRDLIVRAQAAFTPEARRNAYLEILHRDEDKEMRLRDVTGSFGEDCRTFVDFLAAAKFVNGFHAMKCLSIPNRIKWMKLCAIQWEEDGRDSARFGFEKDNKRAGELLDLQLTGLEAHKLDKALKRLDSRTVNNLPFKVGERDGHKVEVFGFEFYLADGEKVLNLDSDWPP